jgi:hypothetical protein
MVLTLVAFKMSIATNMPALSYLTILDKYIICMLVLMGAAMLGAVIVYNGGEGAHTEAEKWHNTVFNICSKCPAQPSPAQPSRVVTWPVLKCLSLLPPLTLTRLFA